MDPRLDTGGGKPLQKAISGFLPTGTFTLPDTPSFARRDNVKLRSRGLDTDKLSIIKIYVKAKTFDSR